MSSENPNTSKDCLEWREMFDRPLCVQSGVLTFRFRLFLMIWYCGYECKYVFHTLRIFYSGFVLSER